MFYVHKTYYKMKIKYKLGEDVKGTCPNCSGRGRRQHLEYNGDDEVICMVCSSIIKLNEIKK